MKDFFLNHKWAILLSVVAIITVLLIYLIGWWTLLAAVFVAAAIFIGRLLDKGGTEAVKDFFARLFKGKNA
jgi:uncharacterized membrane protein